MAQRKKRVNPFYTLLLIAGVAFCITACAYGVMAVKQLRASQISYAQAQSEAAFVQFMDDHGAKLMMAELTVLAIATFAAIGTDRFWSGDS